MFTNIHQDLLRKVFLLANQLLNSQMSLKPINSAVIDCESLGFRFGDRGTHTSRTMMLDELRATIEGAPADASRADYVAAIVEHNCLGKPTLSHASAVGPTT